MLKSRIVLLCLLLHACAGTESQATTKVLPISPANELGAFGVGVMTRTLTAPDSSLIPDGQIEVDIWYPVDKQEADNAGAAGKSPYDNFTGMAVRNLDPADGYVPFPVVIFSHGLAGIRQQNIYQVQYLASRGYIVISGDHHPSTLFDVAAAGGQTDQAMASALQRPEEILAQIDALEEWGHITYDPFFEKIDTRRVMVAGHSFGGYSAFSVSGAKGSLQNFREKCSDDAQLDDNFQCELAREYTGESIDKQYRDARIVSVLPMAPGATPVFAGGFGEIRIPVLMMSGMQDDVAPPELFQDWVWDELPQNRIYVRFANADHLDFSQLCLSGLPIKCVEQTRAKRLELLQSINTLTALFADWTVREIAEAKTQLEAQSIKLRWPDLDYKSDLAD